MADGTDNSYTIYQDKTRYVLVDVYGTLIEENSDVYGMDLEQGFPVHYLFIGDTYEDFLTEYKMKSMYEYNEEEKITSKEVSDGIIYLETELPKEAVEMYYTSYGYTSDDGVKQMQIFYSIPTEEGSLLLEMGSYAGVPETIDAKFEEMLASFKLQ